ncbi:hypothetical protein GCM10010129_39780 [Streptomyces fumigatiscleroticus]|nr:hypothetical protein GCM10010129_39780 [Streptomyces fumigatiscleroticus]
MSDDYFEHLWRNAGRPSQLQEAEDEWHRPAVAYCEPLTPPGPEWDPAQELAGLLEEAVREQHSDGGTVPPPRHESSVTAPAPDSHMGKLQEITAELPPLRVPSRGHRKPSARRRPEALRTASCLLAALAAVIVSMVSVFSGMATYGALRNTAAGTAAGPLAWWPVLIYGPWTAASLSVLRAALHRRRAMHSWCVVLLFSSIAVLLCVVQAPRTIAGTVAAALPAVAALTCFQQLVRQITLTRPPRRLTPRHRMRSSVRTSAPSTRNRQRK